MSDLGQRYTEAQVELLTERLREAYDEAVKDLQMKATSWAHAHEARVRKYRRQVESGEITQADFDAWMRGQIFQERAWKERQQQMIQSMIHADEIAVGMLNDGMPDIFAEGANFMGYEMEHGMAMDFGFGLYDVATVRRLLMDNPDLLPRRQVDTEKDYAWYNGIMNRTILQGILQGESLEEMVMRMSIETGESAYKAMFRNIRTAYNGAQNAGREEGMRQAQQLGLRVRKRWIAQMLSNTRDAHAELNGQTADVDQPFVNALGAIRYPGDPNAAAGNVYNCHCTIGYEYPDFPYVNGVPWLDQETGEIVNDMSYEEWKATKKANRQSAALSVDELRAILNARRTAQERRS